MLCGVCHSHQLITNKAQNRQVNCCILWATLQLCKTKKTLQTNSSNHNGCHLLALLKMPAANKSLVRKMMMEGSIQMDLWWKHNSRQNNAPKLRGTIIIIINVIHFVLFWKHDKDNELWIFWTVLRIVRHKSNYSWLEGKNVTVSYICIADTFCFFIIGFELHSEMFYYNEFV